MEQSLLGRVLVCLMLALLGVIGATAGIDYLARRTAPPRFAMPFPRVVHAAGLIDLLRGADAARRRNIVRIATNDLVRVTITDTRPVLDPDDVRAPHLEERLQETLPSPIQGLEAFSTRAVRSETPGAEGRLMKATAPLGDGRSAIIEWLEPPPITHLKLLGLPPSTWAGILGFSVGALALLTAFRGARPLRRLTESVSSFDGSRPDRQIAKEGAPEVQRLVRAVYDMQERVAGLLAERSFLIGAISHDLRTYLTRMRLRTERIVDPTCRDPMVGDLDAMTRLLESSLGFARGTTSSSSREPVDLGDLVAVEVEEQKALGQRVALSGTYADEAIVLGDPVALRRVVSNVLDNALKFGRTTVTVWVARASTHAQIVIEDDGPGIPDAARAAVFNPFYRVEQSRSRATGGTGLGLAIARQIVESHGGTIELTSAPGTMTSVVIALPALA